MHPELLSMSLFMFVTSCSPGPNNIVASYSGFNFGLIKTIPHMCGVIFGFTTLVIVVNFGLINVFKNFPIIQEILKYGGTIFLDNCKMLEKLKSIKFFNVSYPLLLLPFLSRASDLAGKRISVQYEGNNFLLNFDKTIFSKNIKSDQIVALAKEVSIEFLENNNSFSAQEWKELYKLSEETFVEETDSLKKKGAGAGLTDND